MHTHYIVHVKMHVSLEVDPSSLTFLTQSDKCHSTGSIPKSNTFQ